MAAHKLAILFLLCGRTLTQSPAQDMPHLSVSSSNSTAVHSKHAPNAEILGMKRNPSSDGLLYLPDVDVPSVNSTERPTVDTASTPSPENTTRLLEGNELMEYLFQTEFHRDVMDDACYAKLKAYGYWQRLGFFQRFCLCRLLCIPPHATHVLDEVDKKRVAEARKAKVKDNNKYQFEVGLPLTVGVTTANALLLLVGFSGNTLVLITVAKFMRKPSVTYIFLCSIACSDLLVNTICVPMQIYRKLTAISPSIHFCRTMNFLFYLSLGCSVFSLLAMSTERYLVICHPMKAQVISTTKRAKKIVVVVWLIAAATAAPYVYFTRAFNGCVVRVPRQIPYYIFAGISLAVFYVIPVAIMIYAYTSISISLWRSINTSKALQSKKRDGGDPDAKAKETTERIAVIKMLVLVLAIFIVCWTPYWWYYTLLAYDVLSKTLTSNKPLYEKLALEYAALVVATANSSINPILYAFTSKPFRNGCRDCFLTCFGFRPKSALKEATSKITASTGISAPAASSSVTG